MAQVQAARVNGAFSAGPVSAAGKARSAMNGMRHGLCSARLVFTDEQEEKQFLKLRHELEFSYRAQTEGTKLLVERLAMAIWRQRVADSLELALLAAIGRGEACAQNGGAGLPSLGMLNRYRARIARDMREAKEALADLATKRAQAFKRLAELDRHKAEMRARTGLGPDEGPPEDDFDPETDPVYPHLTRQNRERLAAMARAGQI